MPFVIASALTMLVLLANKHGTQSRSLSGSRAHFTSDARNAGVGRAAAAGIVTIAAYRAYRNCWTADCTYYHPGGCRWSVRALRRGNRR